uniref:ABC transporter n=1 Tax=Coccidioides posadasii RMSCC 3488 TaxID=454284 RepID=A0A0J6FNI9_COCPO|nr:ABC transporter [Coccidioides posadasii RMSCC 3488]
MASCIKECICPRAETILSTGYCKTQRTTFTSSSKKRLGNREGFALLDTQEENMEKVLRELLEIRGQIETLQTQNATLEKKNTVLEKDTAALQNDLSTSRKVHIGVRHGVLEERRISNRAGVRKDRETTSIRNEIAHGGDIIGDIKTIEYAQEQQLPVSFDEALTQAPSYPPEAIRAFDILASVSELYAWQAPDQQGRREILEKQATKIIEAALSTEKNQLQARFGNRGDLRVAFNEMVGDWDQLSPLQQLVGGFGNIAWNMVAAEELLEILHQKPSIIDCPNAPPLKTTLGKIEFRDVSFRAPPGRTTAIVEKSGGGKSTIFNLLFRFYDSTSEAIHVDGQNIVEVTLDILRSVFGVVLQETKLLPGTIAFNLRHARLDATDEEIEKMHARSL